MVFTVNTKPLSAALDLGVVNANVSKFYKKSCLAQITAVDDSLIINLEAAFINAEIRLKGSSDAEDPQQFARIFVDSLLLKQLVSTFETSTISLEFADGGLILHSGKSKFTLPKMVDATEFELKSPESLESDVSSVDIDKSDWKFIKDSQMFAIAMSFIHPVYTRVWVGKDGDVIVGDFENGLFTHSMKNKLGKTCLLSDTIINLFNSLPDGAKLVPLGQSYLIKVDTDGFEFVAQFTPQYEDDEEIGTYNSDIILATMEKPANGGIKVPTAALNKFLSQADLLSNSSEDTIKFSVSDGKVTLKDSNIEGVVDLSEIAPEAYTVEFKTGMLKSVLSNFSDEYISVSPMKQEDEIVGIIVWNKDLSIVLAGVE